VEEVSVFNLKKEQVDGVAECSGNEEKNGSRNKTPNNG
jgi:hypothetical protein